MSRRFRVIDTGLREGRRNIAFDQALVNLHQAGVIGDTIRFLQFAPSALVGRHQAISRELHLDYCRSQSIQTVRRITGGGALFMDEGQLGFELIFHRDTLGIASLANLAQLICEAAAEGIRDLGVNARYRPRNDIEVNGRKISGTGGFFDDDTMFYQGTLLVDFDVGKMLSALNVPKEKLLKRELESAGARVVSLRELLGPRTPDHSAIKTALIGGFARRLDIEPVWDLPTPAEEDEARKIYAEEIGTDDFVWQIDDPLDGADIFCASVTSFGGTVNAHLRLEKDRIREALITGDFIITPPRIIVDLEASLRGLKTYDIDRHVADFFAKSNVGLLSVAPSDFSAAMNAALAGRGKHAAP